MRYDGLKPWLISVFREPVSAHWQNTRTSFVPRTNVITDKQLIPGIYRNPFQHHAVQQFSLPSHILWSRRSSIREAHTSCHVWKCQILVNVWLTARNIIKFMIERITMDSLQLSAPKGHSVSAQLHCQSIRLWKKTVWKIRNIRH